MRLEQIPWKGPDKPTESALAARLAADGFESFLWIDPPDADYSPHAHDHDESLWARSPSAPRGRSSASARATASCCPRARCTPRAPGARARAT